MYNALKPITDLLKRKDVDIYNIVFKLHTKFTVFLLVIFSILVSMTQYFGDPIECITNSDFKESIELYCWVYGTYISKSANKGILGKDLLQYGIKGPVIDVKDRNYQKYYQWVPLVFVSQALLFYVPAFIWRMCENGKLSAICANIPNPLSDGGWNKEHKRRIVQYLTDKRFMSYIKYAMQFSFCELLNFLVVVGNIFLLNWIFQMDFFVNYSPAIYTMLLDFKVENWERQAARIFPKMTKCDFSKYGPSGTKQNEDALCILSLNVLNEKLFAIIWIWLLILCIISGINLLYKTLVWSCSGWRIRILVSQANLRSNVVKLVTDNGSFGKWFLLYKISRNVNPVSYEELLIEIAKKMKKNSMVYEKKKEATNDDSDIEKGSSE